MHFKILAKMEVYAAQVLEYLFVLAKMGFQDHNALFVPQVILLFQENAK